MIKNVYLTFFLLGSLFCSLDVNVVSDYAILINARTKKVLFEKRARQKVYPASTTKIATALWALQKTRGKSLNTHMCLASLNALKSMHENVKRAKNFQIPAYRLEPDGSSIHLKVGEKLSFMTLMHAMLLCSGNDAANVIAESFNADIEMFMQELNEFLRKLGIHNTHFLNPHGLHHPDHFTTAYDMALITSYCLEEDLFKQIVARKQFLRPRSNLSKESLFMQGNQLLKKGSRFYYDKAYGIKTGYTRAAGFNLVAAAKHNDRDLIAVVHKAKDTETRYKDVIDLFNAAFDEKKVTRRLFNKEETEFKQILKGAKKHMMGVLESHVDLSYYPSEIKDVTAKVSFIDLPLPIKKGQKVGYIKIYDEENVYLTKHGLFSKYKIVESLTSRMIKILTSMTFYCVIFLLLALIYLLASVCSKKVKD